MKPLQFQFSCNTTPTQIPNPAQLRLNSNPTQTPTQRRFNCSPTPIQFQPKSNSTETPTLDLSLRMILFDQKSRSTATKHQLQFNSNSTYSNSFPPNPSLPSSIHSAHSTPTRSIQTYPSSWQLQTRPSPIPIELHLNSNSTSTQHYAIAFFGSVSCFFSPLSLFPLSSLGGTLACA